MKPQDHANDALATLLASDEFHERHLGATGEDARRMLAAIDADSIQTLVRQTVPADILREAPLALPDPVPEHVALAELKALAARNELRRSFIGRGYHGTLLPEAIRRNVLENPGWYTAYTPYQAEISQGRLENLLNWQQMIVDLTGLDVANASLLDEATAAAEAMTLIRRSVKRPGGAFLVDAHVHPQVIAVLRTRAKWAGLDLIVDDVNESLAAGRVRPEDLFGAHLQNPDTRGRVRDLSDDIARIRAAGAMVSVGCDPLSLLLVKSPGAMGADVAIGSAQRFGVPMGAGGPHAAFMSARQALLRSLPGRIIGVSKDAAGAPALRMALQTREQHIRRDKATSNICTAQALLANIAAFYAIWHGPQGLRRIALRTHFMTRLLARAVAPVAAPLHAAFFDTLAFDAAPFGGIDAVRARCDARGLNLLLENGTVQVSFDETTGVQDVRDVAFALTGQELPVHEALAGLDVEPEGIPVDLRRTDAVLTHPVFSAHRSETAFMRYLKRLENRDYSLVHGMIPLGSCTMKLNAAAEMAPVTWPEFAALHPMAPRAQLAGYEAMISQLGEWLSETTGFAGISFQPNSGAQGEYAGLLAIRNFLHAKGEGHRDVCLIPSSAHGTNPASAQMMGMRIVVVACDADGNVDLPDLSAKIAQHEGKVAALMVTYPSTHGVFESGIREACARVHAAGGQVYMDGANFNAQTGLTRPGDIGADVCHLNLHKTFCIPHGGGGPGMGPIGVAAHLLPHLPQDPFEGGGTNGAVSAAPWGSALILTISWMYVRMMGASGVRRATEHAILAANYVARRLQGRFEVLYAGANGRVAHECILDLRGFKASHGITAEDVAKRLMDYGFHAPTLSFPVTDTLMVEPTESEDLAELDRFCEAMIAIHGELQRIGSGEWSRESNPLRNAPHTATEAAATEWPHAYTREEAVYPVPGLRRTKFWPAVKRVDNVAGDRNPVCTCPPMSDHEGAR